MGSRVREREYEPNAAAVRYAIDESLKLINTVAPGVVTGFDRDRRSASVRSAFPTILKNGRRIPAPVISDVPVLFPQSRGVSMLFDLVAGDPVMLAFSQRGIEYWRDTYAEADPDVSRRFAYGDAFVLPGFGLHPGEEAPWAGRPRADAAWILQRNTENGGYISLSDQADGRTLVNIEGDLVVSGTILSQRGETILDLGPYQWTPQNERKWQLIDPEIIIPDTRDNWQFSVEVAGTRAILTNQVLARTLRRLAPVTPNFTLGAGGGRWPLDTVDAHPGSSQVQASRYYFGRTSDYRLVWAGENASTDDTSWLRIDRV